jgi:hypothetical protein
MTFGEVAMGVVVEMDILGRPSLFTKLNKNSTRFNCLCISSMVPGHIDLDTVVKVVGKLTYTPTEES